MGTDTTSMAVSARERRERFPAGGEYPPAYDRFSRRIQRIVWRLLGADADRDDIVQQVFLRIIQHSGSLREPEKLNAWIHAITVNAVYEELRRRELRRSVLRALPPGEPHATLVHDVEVLDALRHAKALLDTLPPKERAVFSLVVVEGYSLERVADRLGVSERTARRRLAEAKKRFARLIGRRPEILWLRRADLGRTTGAAARRRR